MVIATTLFVLVFPTFGHLAGITAIALAFLLVLWSAFRNQSQARRWAAIGSFYALTPAEFERHVASTFGYLGYATTLTPRVGDQGVDIIAQNARETIAIQVKRYADKAPNRAVQSVHTGAVYYGCNRAILVCIGGFSRAAIDVARSTNVELIGGSAYADMVHRIAPSAQRGLSLIPRGVALVSTVGLLAFGVGAMVFSGALVSIVPHALAGRGMGGPLLLFLAISALAVASNSSKRPARRRR